MAASVADLASKLQIKGGQSVAVVNPPDGVRIDLPSGTSSAARPAEADVVIAFVRTADELDRVAGPALDAAREDRLAWLAYPKAKQLGTDLNRDTLNAAAQQRGVQGVRQVSIDDVWSALRFRPA